MGDAWVSKNVDDKPFEQALWGAGEHKLAAIFAQAAVGLSEISPQGKFVRVNDELCRILGRSHEEILTIEFAEVTHLDDVPKILQAFEWVVETGEATSVEKRCLRPNGEVVWTNSNLTRLVDQSGQAQTILAVTVDLTVRKNAEEALRQSEERLQLSQKLESVGRLAGGIAHDFNNMLTAIIGYGNLALNCADKGSSLHSYIEEIINAGERSALLTRQLLAFSRKQILQPEGVNLNRLIGETKNILQRLIREDIILTINAAAENAFVNADLGQLTQVIINLVVNAKDAMPHGGRLLIETQIVNFTEDLREHFDFAEPGEYVKLIVSDTGVGMDEETLGHIFEPFYTTKDIGKGTGLGLATVYGIVKQSQGYIRVASEIARGATFSVYLPLIAETKDAEGAVAVVKVEPAAGREIILLVEDEEAVRTLMCEILESSGYQVIDAQNGLEALARCKSGKFKVDLLITDIVMPEMNGRQLAEEIKLLYPELGILFMSGYTDDVVIRHGISEDDINFIQKPFNGDQLINKVRKILDDQI